MIKHIVWWELKEEADGHTLQENAERIKRMGEALQGKIDGLHSIEISYSLEATTTVKASIVLQSVHDDMEALKYYANHPEHLKLAAIIKDVTCSRNAIDYSI